MEQKIRWDKEHYSLDDLREMTAVLRSPEGFPWDREQTLESLQKHLNEEAQEVFQAVEARHMENLCEELGDVLFQVMINSQIASEKGHFSVDDVIDGICRKMVRRHPHVFGDVKVNSVEEGNALWKQIKMQEKGKKP